MATHSSVLAWRIPGTGEPGGLPSMGSHRVGHNWSNLVAAAAGFQNPIVQMYSWVPYFQCSLIYAMIEWPHNFGRLNLYSPKENLLSALLHDCTGKANLIYYFNEHKFILNIPFLHKYEYFYLNNFVIGKYLYHF